MLIALLAGCLSAQAQTYIPFPTANAIWTQREGKGEQPAEYARLGLQNHDTTINGTTYHSLYRLSGAGTTITEWIGGLRESDKKIYYYNYSVQNEQLLFDFNVAVGDTVYSTASIQGIVHDIDSVNIRGTYHKRFNFSTRDGTVWTNGSWIEGIGNASLGGLLGSAMAMPTCDCANHTICFKQDIDWVYHNDHYAYIDCESGGILATEDVSHTAPTVVLAPNPVTGVSIFQVQPAGGAMQLSVYNINGALLSTQHINGAASVALRKADYSSGIYWYLLRSHTGNMVTGKFVVE